MKPCVCCGDISVSSLGHAKYCAICKPIVRKILLREAMMKNKKRNVRCICCGVVLTSGYKYCPVCKQLANTVLEKVRKENYRKLVSGKNTMQEHFQDIAIDVQMSDNNFISDCGVVGMDCEHCPLPDCILEVDED